MCDSIVSKITVIAPEFPPAIGGIENYAFNLVKAYLDRGWALRVLTRTGQESIELPDNTKSIPILRGNRRDDELTIRSCLGTDDLCHVMTAPYAWVATFHPKTFVSIHGKDFLSPAPCGGWRLKDRLGLPRGDQWSHRLDLFLTRRAMHRGLRRSALLLPNSNYTAAVVSRVLRGKIPRMQVLHPGIDEALLQSASESCAHRRKSPVPHLLTVARLNEPRKAVDAVLHALALLPKELDYTYSIVGDGALRPALENLTQELGLKSKVTFHGRCSDEDLHKEYAFADLFILTSRTDNANFEGFGIVYLEANAFGVPVLACRQSGVVDAVAEGKSGWFVEEPSPPQIAEKIGRLLTGALSASTTACREHAHAFSWSKTTDALMAHADSLLPAGSSRKPVL